MLAPGSRGEKGCEVATSNNGSRMVTYGRVALDMEFGDGTIKVYRADARKQEQRVKPNESRESESTSLTH